MTTSERNSILQAQAWAMTFAAACILAVDFHKPHKIHEAAAQLRAALSQLPPVIDGCECDCVGFCEVKRG